MNKGNTESHAETRSSRRESNPPTSALSAAPREKNLETGLGNGSGNDFRFWKHQFPLLRTRSRAPYHVGSAPIPSCASRARRWVMATASIWSFIS